MVFESLFVRLVNQKLGGFIEGLDSKNLDISVLSGNVVLENLKLKSTVSDLLDLPFDLKFSHIKKLVLKIPFSNISAAPVEIELEGLFALFTVQREVDWVQEGQSARSKLENLDQYAIDIIEKMIQVQQKLLQKTEGEGTNYGATSFVDKLLNRILDNIQVRIQDIHVRVEQEVGFKASFGFCLQSIGMFTVDERDKPVFIDRTKSSNQSLALIKKLDVSNLGIYFNANEQKFLAQKTPEEIHLNLSYAIMRKGQTMNNLVDYIFTINLRVRFIQNPKGDYRVPEIMVIADMEKLNFTVEQGQFQQIISMVEYLNKFDNHLQKVREASCEKDKSRIKEQIQIFRNLYPIYYYKQERILDALNNEQRQDLLEAVNKLPMKILQDQTKIIAADDLKSQQISKIDVQKRGTFQRVFGSQKKKNTIITNKEKEKINSFFESLTKQDDSVIGEQAAKTKAPDDYIWLKLKFQFEGGSIFLKKKSQPDVIQGVCLGFSDLRGGVNLKVKGNSITFTLKELGIDIIEEEDIQRKTTSIFGKSIGNKERDILFVRFDEKYLGEDRIERVVKVNLAQAKFQYSALLVQLLIQFFEVSVQDQELKEQAIKKIEELHEKTQQQVEEGIRNLDKSRYSLKLDIFLASPIVIIPFPTGDCFLLQLGNFSLITDTDEENNTLPFPTNPILLKKEVLQCFKLSLDDISCSYFSSLDKVDSYLQQFNLIQSQNRLSSSMIRPSVFTSIQITMNNTQNNQENPMNYSQDLEMYRVIHDFSLCFRIEVARHRQKIKYKLDILPKIYVDGEVTDLIGTLNYKTYSKLLALPEVFLEGTQLGEETDGNTFADGVTQKKDLLKKALKVGFLFKQNKIFKKWEKLYGVLTKGYIYFFEIQNNWKPSSHIRIKYASFLPVPESECGKKNVFKIINHHEEILLGCEKAEQFDKWMSLLRKIHEDNEEQRRLEDIQMSLVDETQQPEIQQIELDETDLNSKEILINFRFHSLVVSLQDKKEKDLAELSLLHFELKAEQRIALFELEATLTEVIVKGFNETNQKKEHQSQIIYNENEELLVISDEDRCAVKVKVLQLDRQHPKYEQTDILVECILGDIQLNFKPDVVANIISFFNVTSELILMQQLQDQRQEQALREHLQQQYDERNSLSLRSSFRQQPQQLDENGMSPEPRESSDSRGSNAFSLNKDFALLQVKAGVRGIQMKLIEKTTQKMIGLVEIKGISVEFIQKTDEAFVNCSLNSFQVFDTTASSNDGIQLQQDGFQEGKTKKLMIHSVDSSKFIQINVLLLNDSSQRIDPDRKETILLSMNIGSITTDIQVQPFMRFIDYLSLEMAAPFISLEPLQQAAACPSEFQIPESLLMCSSQLHSQEEQQLIIGKLQREIIALGIFYPQNIRFDITLDSILIQLKANESDMLQISSGCITVSNKRTLCPNRVIQNNMCSLQNLSASQTNPSSTHGTGLITYQDEFEVEMDAFKVLLINTNQIQSQILAPIKIQLTAQMLAYSLEITSLFKESVFDSSITLEITLSPILMKITHADVYLLKEILQQNILFDDGVDKNILTENNDKQIAQNNQVLPTNKENIDGIKLNTRIDRMATFILGKKDIPFLKLEISKIHVGVDANSQFNTSKVSLGEIDFRYYEHQISEGDRDRFIEHPLLGKIRKYKIKQRTEMEDLQDLLILKKKNEGEFLQIQPITIENSNLYPELELQITSNVSSNQSQTEVTLNGISLVLQVKILEDLGEFVKVLIGHNHDQQQQYHQQDKILNDDKRSSKEQLNSSDFENKEGSSNSSVIIKWNDCQIILNGDCQDLVIGMELTGEMEQKVSINAGKQNILNANTTDSLILDNGANNPSIITTQFDSIKLKLSGFRLFTQQYSNLLLELHADSQNRKSLILMSSLSALYSVLNTKQNKDSTIDQRIELAISPIQINVAFSDISFFHSLAESLLASMVHFTHFQMFQTQNSNLHQQQQHQLFQDASLGLVSPPTTNKQPLLMSSQQVQEEHKNTSVVLLEDIKPQNIASPNSSVLMISQINKQNNSSASHQLHLNKQQSISLLRSPSGIQDGDRGAHVDISGNSPTKKPRNLLRKLSKAALAMLSISGDQNAASNSMISEDEKINTSYVEQKSFNVESSFCFDQKGDLKNKEQQLSEGMICSSGNPNQNSYPNNNSIDCVGSEKKELFVSCKIEDINVILLNDIHSAYIPIIQVKLSELESTASISQSEIIVDLSLAVESNYFNPKVHDWEPVLEKSMLEINYVEDQNSLQTRKINLQGDSLQIIVSSQFLFILNKSLHILHQELNDSKINTENDEDEDQSIEKLSSRRKSYPSVSKEASQSLITVKSSNAARKSTAFSKSLKVEAVDSDKKIQNQSISNSLKNTKESKKNKKKNEKTTLGSIPYIILNKTGHHIQASSEKSFIRSDINGIITIKDNEEIPFQADWKLDQFLKINSNDNKEEDDNDLEEGVEHPKNLVMIRLLTQIFKFQNLDWIDFDEVTIGQCVLEKQEKEQEQKNEIQQLVYKIYTEIRFDSELNRKVLIISSPYLIVNNTGLEISVFIHFEGYCRVLTIKPGETQGVPIEFIFGSLQVGLSECKAFALSGKNQEMESEKQEKEQKKCMFSSDIPILKMKNNNNDGDLSNNESSSFEIKIGELFLLLRVCQDQVNSYQRVFTFEPPYRFRNSLPKPLRFQLENSDMLTAIDQKILPDQYLEVFSFPLAKKIYLRILLDGFFWSEETLLIEGDSISEIQINDLQSSLFVSVKTSQVLDACRDYLFYCKTVIINETSHEFYFSTKNNSKKKELKKQIPGQALIYKNQQIENQQIILLGEESGGILVIEDTKMKGKKQKESQQLKQSTFSEAEVAISGVGSGQIQVVAEIETASQQILPLLIPLAVNTSRREITGSAGQLFMTVVILSPKIIMVNQTRLRIYVKQFQTNWNSSGMSLNSQERQSWYWLDESKQLLQLGIDMRECNIQNIQEEIEEEDPKVLKHSMVSSDYCRDSDILWSGGVQVISTGSVSMCIRDRQNRICKFIRADIRESQGSFFVVIQELDESEIPYVFVNRCEGVELDIPSIPAQVSIDEKAFFGWDEPTQPNSKSILNIIIKKNGFQNEQIQVNPDKINTTQKISLKHKQNDSIICYIKFTISIEGYTKVILFQLSSAEEVISEENTQIEEENLQNFLEMKTNNFTNLNEGVAVGNQPQQNRSIELSVSLGFKKLGISLVSNHEAKNIKPCEILYIYAQGMEAALLQKKESLIFQFKLRFLNIDNNSNLTPEFPVVATPSHYLSHCFEEDSKTFFNLLIEKSNTAQNMNLFNSIVLDIEPMTVSIEEEFISKIIAFADQLVKGMELPDEADSNHVTSIWPVYSQRSSIITGVSQSTINNIGNNLKYTEDNSLKIRHWQKQSLPQPSLPTFIDQIILSPINLTVSFKAKTREQGDSPYFVFLATALGVALSNVESAPLTLKGIQLSSCFDTAEGICQKLILKYKEQAVREIFHVLGSLNVIGNPISLFTSISTGVNEFIDKPRQGMVHGPLETGVGFILGTSSLIRGIAAGTFNSVNKITGSFSTGVAHLCIDEDFMKSREKKRKNQARHVFEGLEQGLIALTEGVTAGVIDVFAKPISQTQQHGWQGLLKGTWQGVSGLIVKPLSGILDAASKTAEGISNTATYFDDKPNPSRIRSTLPFYGMRYKYQTFNKVDADTHMELSNIKAGRFKDNFFGGTYILDDRRIIVVLSEAVLIQAHQYKKNKEYYVIIFQEIDNIQRSSNGIAITIKPDSQHFKDKQIVLLMKDKKQRCNLHRKLEGYLKQQFQ